MAKQEPETRERHPRQRAIEDRLERVALWHVRYKTAAAEAASSLSCRDWEMWEAMQLDRIPIAQLATTTGLTHAALYKAVRRGSTFREPPLPF